MKNALLVGIDYYTQAPQLHACVNDVLKLKKVLERNEDKSINFHTTLKLASNENTAVSTRNLKDAIKEIFNHNAQELDIALFYYSGHGFADDHGGYLIASDSKHGDDGVSMQFIMENAKACRAKSKIIILDCCHSGKMGEVSSLNNDSLLIPGTTILTASNNNQIALAQKGSSVFTELLVDALNGSAANLLGDITPGSVYAHIDQSLGGFEQRPIFKANVTQFTSLRRAKADISLANLHEITRLFPKVGNVKELDPSYEPERYGHEGENTQPPDPKNVKDFGILQKYNRLNLLKPEGASKNHMYHAAMESKFCRLTALGQFYWNLVKKEII